MLILISVISLVLQLLNPPLSYSQPDTLWTKKFGGDGWDKAESIKQTNDGGFIIVGNSSSFGGGWLIRTDSLGVEIWSRGIGGSVYSVIQTIDRGFAVVGFSSVDSHSDNALILKIDLDGNSMWQMNYTSTDDEVIFDLAQKTNGEIIAVGYSSPHHSYGSRILLLGLDISGGLIWQYIGSYDSANRAKSIAFLTDGGFIVTGTQEVNGDDLGDLFLLRLNAEGDSLWMKTYGGSGGDGGEQVIETSDGGFIAVGGTNSFGTGRGDVWVVRTDSSGDTLWTKTYGGTITETGNSIIESDIGGFIVVADSGSHHDDSRDLWLFKVDKDGKLLWSQTYGGNGAQGGSSIQNTPDGGFVVAGFAAEDDSSNADFWVLRFAPEQTIGVEDAAIIPSEYFLVQNYPNPFNPTTTIEYTLPKSREVRLTVYNLLAEEVTSLVDDFQQAGFHKVNWDASNFASGIYFYRLQAGDFVQTRKMVLLK